MSNFSTGQLISAKDDNKTNLAVSVAEFKLFNLLFLIGLFSLMSRRRQLF